MAKKAGLKFLTLEQDSIGGSVFNFPRNKVVMTAPMNLPIHGKAKLFGTSKSELLDLWYAVLSKNDIDIQEHTKVEGIRPDGNGFIVATQKGKEYATQRVLLAIGRRGSPKKLGIDGEQLGKVAYRLLEPERIFDKKILVVGGGDSAIEAALTLIENNDVLISYRKDVFWRIKSKNRILLKEALKAGRLKVIYNSNLIKIETKKVHLKRDEEETRILDNDLVYIFAGGEMPMQFLKKTGVVVVKRFGYTMRKYG